MKEDTSASVATRRRGTSTAVLYLMALIIGWAGCHAGPTAPGGAADQATHYVATSGSDRNSGTIESPWRTISYAVQQLRAGDTLLVRGGSYVDSLNNPAIAGTSWSNPIRIAAYSSETVWLVAAPGALYALYLAGSQRYLEFDGINIDGRAVGSAPVKIEGWSGGNAHHIRIKNAELISGSDGVPNQGTDGGAHAIIATAAVGGIVGGNEFQNLRIHGGGDPGDFAYAFYIQSDGNLIENCNISDTSGAGIQIYNGYGMMPTDNIVRNNTIHDIRRSGDVRIWGIVVSGNASQILGNTLYNIGRDGSTGAAIDIYRGHGTIIDSNTVYNNQPIGIYVESGATDTVASNNMNHDNPMNFLDLGVNTLAVKSK